MDAPLPNPIAPLLNPHNVVLPDYSGEVFTTLRTSLTTAMQNNEAVITLFNTIWTGQNVAEKTLWDAHITRDAEAAAAHARAEQEASVVADALEAAESTATLAEDRKKYKFKYLPVTDESFGVPTVTPVPIPAVV